jgi:cobalt/nickel transport system ATP-binding protein
MLFELQNVGFHYLDGAAALEGVSFSIAERESVALLGANGSGKSTLLKLLAGLQFAHRGIVSFRGEPLSDSALRRNEFGGPFRQAVGLIFQNADAQLFNATVYEEVAYGPRQLGLSERDVVRRTHSTLQFLGIGHLADRAPFRLSGGEKRRVAIASVLSMNPDVLMFDEPFLGLDPKGQCWLVNTLRLLQEAGKTTVIATHTLDLAPMVAQTAIVLGEDHRLLRKGPISEVFLDQKALIDANLIAELEEATR